MKTCITLAFVACLFSLPSTTWADTTFTIVADSTMDGNSGSLMRVVEDGEIPFTVFLFEEAEKIRIYGMREDGSSVWDIFPGAQYICQIISMNINDSWRHVDDNGETVATVVAQESIITPAGTFSCFKVDVAYASAPGTVIESLWFSSGVGLVRDIYPDWESHLKSYTIVGGLGFFPLAVGNTWEYDESVVDTEPISWGAVKSKYE